MFCTIGGIGSPERRRAGVPGRRRADVTQCRDAGLQNSSDAMVFRDAQVATGKLNREHQGKRDRMAAASGRRADARRISGGNYAARPR